jgi:osmoprotectant transport system substrate-binding protein
MRSFRKIAHGAALIALAFMLGACGSGVSEDGGGDSGGGGGGGGGEPVASQLTLGGPPECPKRPFCIPGLKKTYGVEFESFEALDVGGPLTVKALEAGRIDVGLLFTTSSVVVEKDWVILDDDKDLQPIEAITPVVNQEVLDGTITELLNEVSSKLTTEKQLDLNGRVELDGEDPAKVATDFLEKEGVSGEGAQGSGEVTVGAVVFAENQIVAEMYAQVLEQAGYTVSRQLDLGSREILLPALESGEVDIAPEYTGTLLITLDPKADVSGTAQDQVSQLKPLLAKRNITILEPSEASDTNAFVVTPETAQEFGLKSVSDLAKPGS